MTSFTFPIYEIYIDNFKETSTSYNFNLVLNGDGKEFVLGSYVNNELIRTTKISFSQQTIPVGVSKNILKPGVNKFLFKIYSKEINDKFFGSEEKPHIIYMQVDYEKD